MREKLIQWTKMAVKSVAFLRVEYRIGQKQGDASGVLLIDQWRSNWEQATPEVWKSDFWN